MLLLLKKLQHFLTKQLPGLYKLIAFSRNIFETQKNKTAALILSVRLNVKLLLSFLIRLSFVYHILLSRKSLFSVEPISKRLE